VALSANSRHRIGDVSQARSRRGPHVFMRQRLAQLSSWNSHARWSRLMPRVGERRGVGYGREEGAPATFFCLPGRWSAPIATRASAATLVWAGTRVAFRNCSSSECL
jgi:hypothetical protein